MRKHRRSPARRPQTLKSDWIPLEPRLAPATAGGSGITDPFADRPVIASVISDPLQGTPPPVVHGGATHLPPLQPNAGGGGGGGGGAVAEAVVAVAEAVVEVEVEYRSP